MKEDSGFGFKDRAKAEETLRLLEEHDPGYRRLTVRGLLGRAKRVLSMTKAEDKIKNIKEAMEVFEKWLAELDANKEKKPDKKEKTEKKKKEEKRSSSDEEAGPSDTAELPPEGVPGLGFKDPAAARATLAALEGRDPEYQLLAVRGLLGSARRVLKVTRDETKLADIKAAVDILEQFTRECESSGMAARNNSWLGVGFVRTAHVLAGDSLTELQKSFLSAYTSVRGEYKRLRNVTSPSGVTWDRERNRALHDIKEKHATAKLFNDKDEPTKEHLEMLVWAYSPDANRVKKLLKETKEEAKTEKMDVDSDEAEKNKDGGEKKHGEGKTKDGADKKKDGDDKKKDGGDKKKGGDDKKKDDGDKKKEGAEKRSSDRKRRSSIKSDEESHSKKRKD